MPQQKRMVLKDELKDMIGLHTAQTLLSQLATATREIGDSYGSHDEQARDAWRWLSVQLDDAKKEFTERLAGRFKKE